MDDLTLSSPDKKSRLLAESGVFFLMVLATALSLSFIFALIMYHLGLPYHPQRHLMTGLYISACVGVPMAIIASQEQVRQIHHKKVLEELASTDLLTGLLNRRFFTHAAKEEIQRMQRSGYESSLILIDIDMFKKVNDTFGHSFGDEVLKTIATITYDELRGPFDRIGRWGGEEFIILLNAVTADQALQVAERIRQRIATTMIHFNGQSAQVTASFGFTKLTASDAFEGALIDADKALYQAKRDGRNCVCCNLRPSRKIKAQQAANAA